uniref:G_PROTEIN_RECEP_F3_4 domain-containing protein n=1 Tax=Haemonchus contortus TaxID=6289 RepID=A0A7I4YI08_HAECO
MMGVLQHTNSTCASVLHDELYDYSTRILSELSISRGVCLEQTIDVKGGSKSAMGTALRRLLLTEARIVIVLLGDKNWIELMKALRTELVIAGRFIFLAPQQPRWATSKQFIELWPQFDQLLLTVAPEKTVHPQRLVELTSKIAVLPFPQHWLKQFWATAFQCHIDGETVPGQQFSKKCSHQQMLNVSIIAPDLDIGPISIAVNAIARATRKMVDRVCPGALMQRLSDCINDPQELLFSSILSLDFPYQLSNEVISFNETTAFRDHTLVINRALFDAHLEYEPVAEWNTLFGFTYAGGAALVMEERDGSRVPLRSICPRSTCSSELARRSQSAITSSFRDSLRSITVLVYTICAVLASFICLMCMYQQVICTDGAYRICTAFSFGGLAMLCLVSIGFYMTPNPIACFTRKVLFPVAVAAVFAPITVKSFCIWRVELLTSRGEVRRAISDNSPFFLWLCPAVVLLQIVISSEWAFFESSTEMTYVVSLRHGNAWRCAPGDDFEHRVLWSSLLSGLMLIASMIFATLTVRLVESRQTILVSVLSIIFVVALYIGLPLVAYRRRDIIFAIAQLVLCFITVLIFYCQRAFEANDKDSSNTSLAPSTTGRRSQQLQPYWVDGSVYRNRAQKHYDDYHLAAPVAQLSDSGVIRQGATKQQKHMNCGPRLASARSDSYDVAPVPSDKYGLCESAVEEGDQEIKARL